MARPKKPATKAKTVQMSFRMEILLKEKFERFAEEDHVDLAVVARKALREYVDRREAEHKAA
jgi:predicted transcriptional regulator